MSAFRRMNLETINRKTLVAPGPAQSKTRSKPDTIVIVDPLHTGVSLARAASQMGFSVLPVFTVPSCMVRASCFRELDIKLYQFESNVKRAVSMIEYHMAQGDLQGKVVAVVPGSEPGVELANDLARKMGLPHNAPAAPGAFRDKAAMRKVWREAGVAGPGFRECRTEEDAVNYASTNGYPVIAKPRNSAGANLVFKCENENALVEAFRSITTTATVFNEVPRKVLVEDYIGGEEYIVDVCWFGSNRFVIMGCWEYENTAGFLKRSIHRIRTQSEKVKEVIDVAVTASRSLGISVGPVHCEVKVDPLRGVVPIEVGARLPGANLAHFYRFSGDLNAFDLVMEAYRNFGNSRDLPEAIEDEAQAMLMPSVPLAHRPGLVTGVLGVDRVRQLSSFRDVVQNVERGDLVMEPESLVDQPFIVRLAHQSEEQLLNDKREVESALQLETEPTPPVVQAFIEAGIPPGRIKCGALLSRYESNATAFTRSIRIAIRPRNLGEVERIVAVANQSDGEICLYPVSTGRNWSLGSTLPVENHCVVVDMQDIDQILHVDPEERYVVVSPGTTQGQVSEFLSVHHPDLMINPTGGYGRLSLMGNCLDRGDGVFGSRAKDILGLEVLLANGEKVRVGGSWPRVVEGAEKGYDWGEKAGLDSTAPAFYSNPGVGPDLRQAFEQSNFGLVTSLVFRLRKRGEQTSLVYGTFPRAALKEVFSFAKDLCDSGLLDPECTRIGMELEPPEKNVVEKEKRGLRGVVPRGRLVLNSVITGACGLTDYRVREFRERLLREVPDLIDSDSITVDDDAMANLDSYPEFAQSVMLAASGRVNWKRLGGLYEDANRPHEYFYNLDETSTGMTSFLPGIPMGHSRHLLQVFCLVEDICLRHKMYPIVAVEMFGAGIVMMMFDRSDPASVKRAHACKRALYDWLVELGYGPHRMDIEEQARKTGIPLDRQEVWGSIKRALDPKGIFAPGRYGIRTDS